MIQEQKRIEHTHRISTPYAAIRCTSTQYTLYCSYVGGDAHVANTWQTFTLTCASSGPATTYGFVYMYILCTRYEYIVNVSVSSTAISHSQLMVCSNLCKHNNLAATVSSTTSEKQLEKNPDLLKYGTLFAKPKN